MPVWFSIPFTPSCVEITKVGASISRMASTSRLPRLPGMRDYLMFLIVEILSYCRLHCIRCEICCNPGPSPVTRRGFPGSPALPSRRQGSSSFKIFKFAQEREQ
jgi:hypothetical protein